MAVQLPIIIGSIPRLSDIVGKVAAAALKNSNLTLTPQINSKSGDVCVMITDEAGRTIVES